MDFYRRMEYVCARIPYGKVASYGQIALLCGRPKNARQVGFALRRKLAGETVFAHRIVNGSGFLSGAGAFEHPDTQRTLLEAEGVMVTETDKGWRVNMKQFGWKNTLAEAEELYRLFEEKEI